MGRKWGRGVAGLALAAAMLFASSACSQLPLGTDGDLANQWPAMAAPAGWDPKPDSCHEDFAKAVARSAYKPVSCTATHSFETAFVGEFTGDAAKLSSPPATGTPERSAAWKDCDAKISEFVGAPWREGKFWIGVSTPSTGAWDGGARWFTCQVGALTGINGTTTSVTRSLKGELTRESTLRNGCFKSNGDKEGLEVACTEGHNYEFAGTFDPSLTWDELQDYEKTKEGVHRKCRSVIAAYVGVPDDGKLKYRTGTSVQYPGKADWEAGDHQVRCHLWLSRKTLTRSLKGTGNSGLPIQYA